MDGNYCIDELNAHTQKFVKFILNNVSSKLPIKQSEIMESTDNRNKHMFKRTLRGGISYLQAFHGLDLIEVPDIKTGKCFIVVSTMNAGSELDFTNKQQGEITLLFLILSYIFMKGYAISEDNIIQYLSKLKIYIDDPHTFFGEDIRNTISQTFVKQLYLKREKDNTVNAVKDDYLYSWGFRSTIEYPKEKVLKAVAEIMGKPVVCFLRQQFEIAELNECADIDMI